MQNKGFVKVIAVLMSLICLFYLSFSAVTAYHQNKAEEMGAEAGAAYLDSLQNEKVWLGSYTLKQCSELQIGLGLDLKGGMNVILEVSVPDVVKTLAGSNAKDPKVAKAIAEAAKESENGTENFVDLFVSKFQQENGEGQLGGIFALRLADKGITPNSADADVKKAIEEEVLSAVKNSHEIVRSRIDRFGVAQPNIQMLEGKGQIGQIMVEMPGIKEPERVRKLLQGSANLEFWETYTLGEVRSAIAALDAAAAKNVAAEEAAAASAEKEVAVVEEAVEADTASVEDAAKNALADFKKTAATEAAPDAAEAARFAKEHPLFSKLIVDATAFGPDNCVVGIARASDTAEVNAIIYSEMAQELLPADLCLRWAVKASDRFKGNFYELYALKADNGGPAMAGEVISSAKDDFNQFHQPIVSMQMTTDGARDWAQLTKRNIKRCVAIVLDDVVYSAPTVKNEIPNGSSEISGQFTLEDTKDLANVLNSGKMPAPMKIVQEETVGPSLGAASIQAGFTACLVALVLLMIFMCGMYGFIPGMVANSALFLNFFFTFGVLTSFQAALTMSGIAGMVLSLGMAVDANVLIYERTKEELRAGKGVKAAIADGYGNAFSAIFDSNLTSIITAVILYNFGTGPIRGFAMTLGIGICASFFTAVWMTRIVYEHFLAKDKWTKLTFNTKLSRGVLENTKINFMGQYGKSFVIFGIAILLGAVSLGVRGLSKGIDFTGGRNYVVQFEKDVTPEEVREALAAEIHAVDPDASVGAIAIVTADNKAIRVTTNYRIHENNPEIDAEVEQFIYNALKKKDLIVADYATFIDRENRAGGSIISAQKVGPSVAADMALGAIKSVLFSLVAIFLYILIRFRNVAFSIGSVVTLTVDTLLILGVYSACWGWMPFSLEVDQTFIAAILTAIGYSINDKVVVFDRIREYLNLYPKRNTKRLFNDSLNSTLTRTLTTSGTTLLVLLCIFFLGGDSIRSFSFAMMLGVIFGTCSSIFLAAPIAYLTFGKKRIDTGEEK